MEKSNGNTVKLCLAAVFLLLGLLGVSRACAQDGVAGAGDGLIHVYRLPQGQRLTDVQDGVSHTYQCYGLSDFKLLLRMDADLRTAESQVSLMGEQTLRLSEAVVAMRSAVSDSNDQRVMLEADRERLRRKWEATNEARLKAENRPVFGGTVPWLLTGALGVLSGTLLVLLVAQ